MVEELSIKCKSSPLTSLEAFTSSVKNGVHIFVGQTGEREGVYLSKHQARLLRNWLDKAIEEMR